MTASGTQAACLKADAEDQIAEGRLESVRIEVPESIQDLKGERPESGVAWRQSTRRAFEHYLGQRYRVEAFYRDAGERRCWYGLEKESGLERD